MKRKKSGGDEEEEADDANKKEKSVLQAKLTNLAKQIGYAGMSFFLSLAGPYLGVCCFIQELQSPS